MDEADAKIISELNQILNQFLLLGVHADDGVPLADEFVPTTANESELPVAITWKRRRVFLMIDTQPEGRLFEESASRCFDIQHSDGYRCRTLN